MADEASKREEDRINRTLNNIGRRGAPRPVSWNVPQTAGLNTAGGVGSIGRHSNVSAIKSIQEQIREEERRQQALQAQQQQHQQQQQQPHHDQPQQTPTPQYTGGSVLGDVEDDAAKERRMKLEEERLERWMKRGDSRFDEISSRGRSISIDSASDHLRAASSAFSTSKLTDLAMKFQDQVYQASKALRAKKPDDVVKHSFQAAITAKAIAELLSDDQEILSFARALEAGIAPMRTSVDSGGDAQQYFAEVAGYLGQLFISTIGAI
jgi:hypothetical protein